MRASADQPYEARATRTAAMQSASSAERECISATGVAAVWQSTLGTFVLRALAILLVTCVCIAGPAILGLLIYAALGLDTFVHMGGPLATWEAIITLRSSPSIAVVVSLGLQVGLGAIGLAFARGVIARLSLSDSDTQDALSLSAACREAKARFPSLLVGSLLYGAFVMFGAVGINAVLCDTSLDLRHIGRRDVTASAKTLALRALDAFVPSPGSPFAEFVPLLRHSSFAGTAHFASTRSGSGDDLYWPHLISQLQAPLVGASTSAEESGSTVLAISLASLVALMLAEALLRFTPVMAMRARERTRLGAITPVLHSVWFGIRYFGAITKHVWLLRLAFVAGYSTFFMLPIVLSQHVLPPVMTSAWKSVMGSWPVTLTLVCYWLVAALFVAFSTIYDARLAMHLDPRLSSR